MSNADLVARLKAHRTVGHLPEAELEWIVAHGELLRLEVGTVFAPEDATIESLWIVLDGALSIRVDRGTGPRKVMEWSAGDVTGYLPYSRMTKAPGESTADMPTEVLGVHRRYFPEMIARCPELTATLVHVMVDRARHFTSADLHAEKILSLGRIAAGLAHELNNPASAVVRGAKALLVRLEEAEAADRALGASGMSPAALDAVCRLQGTHWADATTSRSALDRADREDAILEWLSRHHIEVADVEPLARSSVTLEELDALAAVVGPDGLRPAMRAVVASRSIHHLAWEIETAASRIHALVSAVKGFTRLDQAPVPEVFALGQGLRDTVAVLGSKARAKNITLTVEAPETVPRVTGVASELNQVWSNLIDNALDAAPTGGHVEIAAKACNGGVEVSVTDDGPGIPKDVQTRIFEPFYTTKPVGQGTGLGLDIARRLVRSNDGAIEFDTRPGRTTFRVRLPGAKEA